jgi:NAD(P)-dependent dehydrogenase (short-subunit alcohol dehydrogenase family)
MLSNGNNNRVAVITGASKGFGKAIAEEFAKAGYCLLINSPNEQDLKTATQDISSLINNDNRIAYLAGDISNENFCELLMDEAVKRFGSIDVLINNGKITVEPRKINENECKAEQSVEFTSDYFVLEEFEYFSPKIKGVYLCIKSAAKRMLNENKKNCSIINISSCQGCMPQSIAESYTFSKSGIDPYTDSIANIETITKTIALELADTGIRVNGIIPGLVDTDINKEIKDDKQKRTEKEKEVPIKRIARAEEISKVALFLASEDASYITGAMIPVDGGLMLSRPNYFIEVH